MACAPAFVPVGLSLLRALGSADAWADLPMAGVRWVFIIRSIWMALLIAGFATLLAIPIAQTLRRSRARFAALLLAPLWMPAWLSYAGLNLARAPDTLLGGAILDLALPDHRWAIVLLGRAVAVGSLVLWSTPIAALVLAATTDPEAASADELLRTERLSALQRVATRFRLHRSSLLTAIGSIFLLTVGSSIPLHLAQIETDAIVLWRALSERTPDRWGGVWISAYPELVIAVLGAAWLVRQTLNRPRPGESAQALHKPPKSIGLSIVAWSIWAVAALLPTSLMLWSLDSWASIPRWFALNHDALKASAVLSALGGLLAASAGVLIAGGAASDRLLTRLIALLLAGFSVFAMLIPGVLVGAAIVDLEMNPTVAGIAASAARTLFVGAIAGLVVARIETPDAAAMRSLDAYGDALGWIRIHSLSAVRLFVGVWIASFLIGLQEIEAATLVRPPGTQNLPQQMLSNLHYARLEQLSAGGVVLGLFGIVIGVLGSAVLSLRIRQPDPRPAVPPPI